MLLEEIIGWTGVSAIVVSYMLASWGIVNSDKLSLLLLNTYGGLALTLQFWMQEVWTGFSLNAFWVLIGLVGIWRWLKARQKSQA